MEQLNKVIFYTIDKSIRTYRQYAQKEFIKAGLKITIDQWLIIKTISENSGMTHQKLSESVFKDGASVTRIITLLVKAGYLIRKADGVDKRRNQLKVTEPGKKMTSKAHAIVLKNRKVALKGLSKTDIENMKTGLLTIVKNCSG
jgi:MarR family transcriptional regulator for hemolysin